MKTSKSIHHVGTLVVMSLALTGLNAWSQENEDTTNTDPEEMQMQQEGQMQQQGEQGQMQHQAGTQSVTSHDFAFHKANDVLKKDVENTQGEKLGSINDLIVDVRNGQIPYAVISSGGLLGIGATQRVVPLSSLQQSGKSGTFALNISKDRWSSAPSFDKDRLADLSGNAGRDIYQYYGASWPAETTTAQVPSAEGVPTPTGRETGHMEGSSLHLATNVIGYGLVNRQNEDLGKINDLLVDWKSGHQSFAVIAAGGLLKSGDKFLVPLRSLKPGDKKDQLVIDADKNLFDQARNFDQQTWSAESMKATTTGSPQIFRYDEKSIGTQGMGTHERGTEPGTTGTGDPGVGTTPGRSTTPM